jgi:hypothetical protein
MKTKTATISILRIIIEYTYKYILLITKRIWSEKLSIDLAMQIMIILVNKDQNGRLPAGQKR